MPAVKLSTIAAAACAIALAQAPFRTRTELVALNVTVIDDQGNFVGGLAKEAFTVTEDGKARPIEHFSTDPAPLSLVIALDASESMSGPRFAFATQAVTTFFEAQRAEDESSVIGFNDRVFSIAPWSRSPSAIRLALDRVQPIGATALFAAVVEAVDALRGSKNRRQAVVVLSDGKDFLPSDPARRSSGLPPEQVRLMLALQRLEQSEAIVYAIGIDAPSGLAQNLSNTFDANALRRLTEPTGGSTIVVRSNDAVPSAAARIVEELGRQYMVGFAPAHIGDKAFHRVKVAVAGCAKCRVRARAGYFAAP